MNGYELLTVVTVLAAAATSYILILVVKSYTGIGSRGIAFFVTWSRGPRGAAAIFEWEARTLSVWRESSGGRKVGESDISQSINQISIVPISPA